MPTPTLPPAPMSMQAVIECAWRAGFPGKLGATMGAIAKRESGLIPTAHNFNEATGDDSWGLWQINMKVPQIVSLMNQLGLTKEQLVDPDINAKVAFHLWGGKRGNLNIAWYIDSNQGTYRARYESHLPEAQFAALASALGI